MMILSRTNPQDLLAEFGIHDRYAIERSRVSRKIKQVVIVRDRLNDLEEFRFSFIR